jgi:predicted metal-binding membrane protein
MNEGSTLPASVDAALEAAIGRDRIVVIAALVVVIALSWAYLVAGAVPAMPRLETPERAEAFSDDSMVGMAMAPAVWTPGYAALMYVMWCVMAVAMMLPSAAPMILLFAAINRKQFQAGHPRVATCILAIGYLSAWAGFSLVAVILQWGFQRIGVLSPMLASSNTIFGGCLLLAAGAWQLTPIKHACLRRCRSPLAFLAVHWRQGAEGALRMGLVNGAFCVGCCWALMGLMFFGGVMNLYWIAGLATLVALEKTLPAGHWLGNATGVALLAWGAGMLALAL